MFFCFGLNLGFSAMKQQWNRTEINNSFLQCQSACQIKGLSYIEYTCLSSFKFLQVIKLSMFFVLQT